MANVISNYITFQDLYLDLGKSIRVISGNIGIEGYIREDEDREFLARTNYGQGFYICYMIDEKMHSKNLGMICQEYHVDIYEIKNLLPNRNFGRVPYDYVIYKDKLDAIDDKTILCQYIARKKMMSGR